jgi:hypothetical protein
MIAANFSVIANSLNQQLFTIVVPPERLSLAKE